MQCQPVSPLNPMVFTSWGEYKWKESENASHITQDEGSKVCVSLSRQKTERVVKSRL